MNKPQPSQNEIQAAEDPPAPASRDTRKVVDLTVVLGQLDSLEAQLPVARGQIADMKARLEAAAIEATRTPGASTVVLGAPAIILRKPLENNRTVPGTDLIYMGTLEHPRVGRPLNIFSSGKDCGVMTAGEGMVGVGNANRW